MSSDTTTPLPSDADIKLARRIDAVEERVIVEGGPMVGSAVGAGSILAFIGPEGAIIGVVFGLVAGYLVPRFIRRPQRS